jgi:hypothetical protein
LAAITSAVDAALPGQIHRSGGPLTRARLMRSKLLHALGCILGATPFLMHASPALQALGWGLWLPGLGFVSVGGWSLLWVPATFVLFAVAFVAWFGSGMIIAPILVWVGSALAAAAIAGPQPTHYAPVAVPLLTLAFLATTYIKRANRYTKALERRAIREAALPAVIKEIRGATVAAPPLAERELGTVEIGMLRYLIDRALQPIGVLNGFDKIDQFQTSALRYQLNQVGWALAIVQRHHLPNFHGYLNEAQQRVIDQYLQGPIWGYWRLENLWGNLSLNTNPAKKDNVMLTGYLPVNALLYMINTGDDRYGKRGSMSFMRNAKVAHEHDIHSIVKSVLDNFQGHYDQPFCLYPCEPNWIYPACNFRGLTVVRLYDTMYGTQHFDAIKDRFRARLEAEFLRADGGVVPLRSKLTGHELPFPAPDAVNVKMLSPLFADLAEKYWAICRHEDVYREGTELRVKVPDKAVDFGNYKPGNLFVMDGFLGASTEMGDREVVNAVKDMALRSDKLKWIDGVTSFTASNMANVSFMESWMNVTHGWRDSILSKPPAAVLKGPILAAAAYPDVLVALAISHGDDLKLVLYSGGAAGDKTLGLERLQPGARYQLKETGYEFTADSQGKARLAHRVDGRTELHIVPAR